MAAATSRDTVDGARPRRLAITRHESPASNPREISSRSGSDSRNADWGVDRGFTPPVLTNNRCTDFAEHPTAVARHLMRLTRSYTALELQPLRARQPMRTT